MDLESVLNIFFFVLLCFAWLILFACFCGISIIFCIILMLELIERKKRKELTNESTSS